MVGDFNLAFKNFSEPCHDHGILHTDLAPGFEVVAEAVLHFLLGLREDALERRWVLDSQVADFRVWFSTDELRPSLEAVPFADLERRYPGVFGLFVGLSAFGYLTLNGALKPRTGSLRERGSVAAAGPCVRILESTSPIGVTLARVKLGALDAGSAGERSGFVEVSEAFSFGPLLGKPFCELVWVFDLASRPCGSLVDEELSELVEVFF